MAHHGCKQATIAYEFNNYTITGHRKFCDKLLVIILCLSSLKQTIRFCFRVRHFIGGWQGWVDAGGEQ